MDLAVVRPLHAALLLTLLAGLGCSRSPGPAGFWAGFRATCLREHASNQGPWGGTRMLRWAACDGAALSEEDARTFAERHGWRFIDRIDAEAARIEGSEGTTPRFLPAPSTVLRFDSGWIREAPGSGETSTAIGYVQVARDGSSMYVFHFWGNG